MVILDVTFNVIRKYYPDLSDEDLRKIQVFIYELCCELMQRFYGYDWEKDIEGLDLEIKKVDITS